MYKDLEVRARRGMLLNRVVLDKLKVFWCSGCIGYKVDGGLY